MRPSVTFVASLGLALFLFPVANACKSRARPAEPAEKVTMVVAAITTPALQGLYKNGDAAAPKDNQTKPFFKIKNTGSTAIALSTITIRYWYTIESGSPEKVWIDYAQMGSANVAGSVVRLPTPATGADRFLEVSFLPGAGSLAAGATSGEIQMRVNKTDWTVYDETNDYSWQNITAFATASKVTLYWNGMLVWGTEPAFVRDCDSGARARVLYVAGDPTMPSDNHVKPHIQLVNTGFADIPLSEVKIRYWFTRDTPAAEQVWIDYAQIGANKITTNLVTPPVAAAAADRYLEVGFTSTAGTLLAGASTGEIQLRFNKTDWSNYSEANDFSYDGARTEYQPSMKVTAYRDGLLLWGQEPTQGAPIPGQSVFAQATLVRNADGTTSSIVGSQTFATPIPMAFPTTMPVTEGNLANQTVSLVLETTSGTVTCSYHGAAPVASPTTETDVALGRVAAFVDCDQACPVIGGTVFVKTITLKVLGSDTRETRTTITLNQRSDNEPLVVGQPIGDTDPVFLRTASTKPPLDPSLGPQSERSLGRPLRTHAGTNITALFTTDPIKAGYVDQIDPNVIVSE